jgi:hypothetical protein
VRVVDAGVAAKCTGQSLAGHEFKGECIRRFEAVACARATRCAQTHIR